MPSALPQPSSGNQEPPFRHNRPLSPITGFAIAVALAILVATVVAYVHHHIPLELLSAVIALIFTIALAVWHTRWRKRDADDRQRR